MYSVASADWATGHSLVREGAYPSVEMQSVYSVASADWATGHSLVREGAYPSVEM